MTLKHRPFKDIYFNGENKQNLEDSKRLKTMTSKRKPQVRMTPELYEKFYETYKKVGNSPKKLAEATGISVATASNWIPKAREKLARDNAKKAATAAMTAELPAVPYAPVVTVKKDTTEEGYYEQKYMTLREQFNEIMKENEKLKLKIEVLNDLVRGR